MQTVHKALEKNNKVAPFLIKGQPIIISSVSTSLSESVRSLVSHAVGKQMDGSVGRSVCRSVCLSVGLSVSLFLGLLCCSQFLYLNLCEIVDRETKRHYLDLSFKT